MLAAAALAMTLPLTQPITLDLEVENAARAVASLSEAARIPLSIQGDIAQEVVFLHLQALPLQEAMDGLAHVTDGKWLTGADGSYTLVRAALPTLSAAKDNAGKPSGALDREIPVPEPSAATRAFWARQAPTGPATTNAGFLPYLTDPVDYEPLALGNQELLTALALSTGKSMVACLPDIAQWMGPGWWPVGEIAPGRKPKTHFSMAEFVNSEDLNFAESNDLVELRPGDFDLDIATRADRAAMAVCVADFQNRGWIDIVDYARAVRPGRTFAGLFLFLADPSYLISAPLIGQPKQPEFSRLLASLSSDQLSRIEAGGRLLAPALSPVQRALIHRLLSPGVGKPDSIDPTATLSCEVKKDEFICLFSPSGKPFVSEELFNPYFGPYDTPMNFPKTGSIGVKYTFQPDETLLLKCRDASGKEVVGSFSGVSGPLSKPALMAALPSKIREKLAPIVARLLDGKR